MTDIHNVATTAAFMAQATPRGDELTVLLDGWGCGHHELIQELTRYAVLSEELLDARAPQDFPGVYDYEVSEEFGAWFFDFVMTNPEHHVPSFEVGKAKLVEMADAFFAQ